MSGIWHLDDLEILSDLSPAEMDELQRASRAQRYDTGALVFGPTVTPQSVYLLKEGAVRIYRLSEKGAEATFGYVQPGEIFGELAAVTHQGRESYAEATTPSVVWRVPIDLFRRLLGSRAGVAEQVSQQLGDRLKRIERRVEGLMFHDVRLRLAMILRELADHFGVRRADGIQIDGDFTQAELATLVGCSRQTLNPCLRELESMGLVHVKRRRLQIPKPEALSEFIAKDTNRV